MDNRANLTALEEEEESRTFSEADPHPVAVAEQSPASVEANKFDTLCNGALNALALVHSAIQQLLGLKDELLKHSLPPNCLLGIAVTSSEVFRSVSDLSMPLSELVRLVRVYSQPWDEKSKSLKKLHDDYESKKSQLAIAIKRLQLLDAHSKRIAKEKRVMNWEKLFAKLTIARGHGRRWKFLIHTFQNKASQGIEKLHEYIDSIERVPDITDTEPDEDQDMEEVDTAIQQVDSTSLETPTDFNEDKDEEEEEFVDDSESDSVEETPTQDDVDVAETYVRPPMADQSTWTHEPEYDMFLHMRVYKPDGLTQPELKCRLSYGTQIQNTPEFDLLHLKTAKVTSKVEKVKTHKAGRKGLIGSRPDLPTSQPHVEESATKNKFAECVFEMPQHCCDPTYTETLPEYIRICVNQGSKKEMIAIASVGLDDLQALELPALLLAQPDGAAVTSHRAADDQNEAGPGFTTVEKIGGLEPINFPLYSVNSDLSQAAPKPIGQLPITCFWGKRLRPRNYAKSTESTTVRDIVLDMIGFDLNLVTKEELHREKVSRLVSPICFTPEDPPEPEIIEEVSQEETVSKWEYENLVACHQHDMNILQQEYEMRLQDLAETLQQMQGVSATEENSRVSPVKQASPLPPPPPPTPRAANKSLPPEKPAKPTSRVRYYKPLVKAVQTQATQWNDNMHTGFLLRLKQYEEEAAKHRQELSERVSRQVAEVLEKKLAGEYKLRGPPREDVTLRDVSLPAVFMPSKGTNINIFNPRAHLYFHAIGSGNVRLTQPPSMLQLPPLPKDKISVMNLFELSQNFQDPGSDWLMDRFINQTAAGLVTMTTASGRPSSAGTNPSRQGSADPRRGRSRKIVVVTPPPVDPPTVVTSTS